MCGIIGFTSNQYEEERIKKALDLITHRGPDSQDYSIIKFGDKYLHLGSTRLSIRGGTTEDMPMSDESGNCLIYNGEIFDTKKLYKSLGINEIFKSDTRLLFEYLKKNKDYKKIEDINGMFAFAFFDNFNNKIVISRDKLGIKPLYYTENNGNFIFSSEQNPIIRISKNNKIKRESITNLLYFGGQHHNHNLVDNISSVKPGEYIEISSENTITKNYYFTGFNTSNYDDNFLEESLPGIIEDHLEADLPVSLFLSGGIDSSLIAYVTKNILGRDLEHYSVSFDNPSFDEIDVVNKISETLNLNKKIFKFPSHNLQEITDEALSKMNNIVLDSSFIPTYYLCKETSNYTKAVISGDGADELFGGYEWYRGIKIWKLLPYNLKQIIYKVISKINFKNANTYLSFSNKLNYFFKYLADDPYLQMLVWQSPGIEFNELNLNKISEEISNYINKESDFFDNLRNIDLGIFLYTNILQKVDTASMAVGLEVRPPYLDDRIVQYALGRNNKENFSLFKNKTILREIVSKTNIDYINKEKKHGFQFPLIEWYEGMGHSKIKSLYKSDNYILFENLLPKELYKVERLDSNNLRWLWSIFIIDEWIKRNNLETY